MVPGLFNSDSFKPDLFYKLHSLFGTLAVHRTQENVIKVNGASVLKTDLMNTNGIIHIVDKVLMPEAENQPAEPLKKKNKS